MRELLKEQYQFSDFQIEQLKYVWKTISSEVSKLLIMGFLFREQLGLYIFAMAVMLLLRTSTGGIHCRKYISCLLVSITYVFLSLYVMPMIPINKLMQMILLFVCILCNYYIGPVTAAVRRSLPEKTVRRVRIQAFVIIFFYLTLTYIMSESPYITVGFWIIILHTLQLIVAKILKLKGVWNHERKTYQVE